MRIRNPKPMHVTSPLAPLAGRGAGGEGLSGRLLLSLLLLAATAAVARGEFDAAARAKTVAPFIDQQTILVAHIDVSRVKVDPLVDRIIELLPEARENEQEARAGLKMFHAALVQAGVKDAYAVFSLADVDYDREPLPMIIVPMGDANQGALPLLFAAAPYEVKESIGGVFFAGTRKMLQRIEQTEPDLRSELTQAFEAAGDTAAQVLLLPPKHAGRVIEEMMPRLPEEIGGGPSRIVTRGARWVAVGMDSPPDASLRLVIQSDDAPAATAFHNQLATAYQWLGRQDDVRRLLPDFEKLASLLTPEVRGDRLTLLLDEQNRGIAALASTLSVPIREARDHARRAQTMNNLKQIAFGMHHYASANKHFPAATGHDADGRPLLSWRVDILPYVEQNDLYKQFHLDEPWDSPHNRTLIDRMPAIYRSPASRLKEKGRTSYLAMVGNGAALSAREGTTLKQITDGAAGTILAVEVADQRAAIWTKPDDLEFDPKQPARGLGGLFPGGFHCLFCDGSAHWIKLPQDPEILRALITRTGGEKINREDLH